VRSFVAAFNTNTAAGMGCLGWTIVGMIQNKGKFSMIGACEGAIAGLVGITPAAGYVSFWLAAVIGLVTGMVCSSLKDLNNWIRVDEGLDVFKLHGIGGMVGAFLTGIFADRRVSLLDGATDAPGAINGVGVQIGKQLADICAIASYSFVVSMILVVILKHAGKFIPGMDLRVSEEDEIRGIDTHEFAEEEIGDWSLFEHTHGVMDGAKVSGPPSPPNEKSDGKTSDASV
jgi:ammonium transporter, Amt family